KSLGERRFLELLNDYFEATAGAVLEHGGEVLRFIGDASLAVFPTTREPPQAACMRAVAAARAARERAGKSNARRRRAGLLPFNCGVGLHLGRVLYGNIGTPNRLEFSVIGAAANEAARIEALCKDTGQDIVLSGTVVAQLGESWPSLGSFSLRGVQQPVEVFALPYRASAAIRRSCAVVFARRSARILISAIAASGFPRITLTNTSREMRSTSTLVRAIAVAVRGTSPKMPISPITSLRVSVL